MLTRIITASLLAPIFILLTIYLPSLWFSLLLLGILLLGLYEWNQLTIARNAIFILGSLVLIVVAWWLQLNSSALLVICFCASLFWVSRVFVLAFTDVSIARNQWLQFGWGLLVMLSTWAALVFVHQLKGGPIIALAIMMIVWAADSFAYFTGKSFGKNKLAPSISPKKTIEGLLGGLIGALLVAWIFARIIMDPNIEHLLLWLLAGVAAALISVVGDLYESALKRRAGVKDSGKLLPGHGGVLDRIDGLVAAAPVFVSIWQISL